MGQPLLGAPLGSRSSPTRSRAQEGEKEANHDGSQHHASGRASPANTTHNSSHNCSSSSFFSTDSPCPSTSFPYKPAPSPSSDTSSPDADLDSRVAHLQLRTGMDDPSSSTSSPSAFRSFSPSVSPQPSTSVSNSSPAAPSTPSSAFGTPTGLHLSGGGSSGDLQRPLFAAFDSTWARPSSTSLESASSPSFSSSSSSPAEQRRHLRPSIVGDHGGSGGFLHPAPSPSSAAFDAAQLQAEVERLMGPALLQSYTASIVPALTSSMSGAFAPLGLSPWLELLRSEGCAFCLGQRDLVDELASPSAFRYVVLQYEPLQSRHIAHLSCLLTCLQATHPSSPSASRLPSLDLFHSTPAARLVTAPPTRALIPSSSSHTGGRRFAVELSLSHACSNVQQVHVSWPHVAHTHVDGADQHHFLFLPFSSSPDDGSAADSPRSASSSARSAPSSPSTAPSLSPSSSPPWHLARFTALRGKLLFSALDMLTQESFEHAVHYDLTPSAYPAATARSSPSPPSSLRLVYTDSSPSNPNSLTVGIHRSRDGRTFSISYLRYDFHPTPSRTSHMADLAHPLQLSSQAKAGGFNGASSSPMSASTTPPSASSSPSMSAFNPSAPSFIPSSEAQGVPFHSQLHPRLSLSTVDDDAGYSSLHSSSPSSQVTPSPFPKPRPFASAPVSSASSPIPSSRNIHYTAAPSPTHLLQLSSFSALPSPHSLHLDPSQPRHPRPGQKPSSGSPAPLPHRSSTSYLSRPANARGGAGWGVGGGEWEGQGQDGYREFGGGRGAGEDVDEVDDGLSVDDDDAKAYERERGGGDRERAGASSSSLNPRFTGNLGYSRRDSAEHGGAGSGAANEQSPLFLPALPTFPAAAPPGLQQVNLGPNPLQNLTVDAIRGHVMRLVKCHAGSRFVQQKLDTRDPAFFALFYDEMALHVPELMVDNFSHFAVEKLIAACSDEQCLQLLQRLAPAICVVSCQKHGSFSVQALVDSLHTPAQVFTLVEAMKADILRIMTHASGHFVVLRMLQRFPYASTKFIDEAICNHVGVVATDHHGLRVFKALLCVRRPVELTRLFKQVARMTMKLVEGPYGNYCVQAVLDVAPPGVRTNIKVKMEGKYMRLSKQKFSSNVVEKCLKQSSSHWRSIIISELTAQPAVAELLRDRYGNYVLQTGLNVANAAQVQDILRAITPYLPSLRDNVRSKWKKMLRKAGAAVQRGGPDERDDGEPASPDPRQMQGGGDDDGDGDDGMVNAGMNAGVYGGAGGDSSASFSLNQQSPHGGSPSFNYRPLPSPSHGHFPGGGGGSPSGGQLAHSSPYGVAGGGLSSGSPLDSGAPMSGLPASHRADGGFISIPGLGGGGVYGGGDGGGAGPPSAMANYAAFGGAGGGLGGGAGLSGLGGGFHSISSPHLLASSSQPVGPSSLHAGGSGLLGAGGGFFGGAGAQRLASPHHSSPPPHLHPHAPPQPHHHHHHQRPHQQQELQMF